MDKIIKALGRFSSEKRLGLVAFPCPFASYFVTNKKAINGNTTSNQIS